MRRLTSLATCFTLIALAAACGSSASAFEVVTKAPDATISETTAKVAMTLEVSGGDLPRKITTSGDGAIDFAQQATAMTLDLSDTLGQMGVTGDDAKFEARSRGTTMYLRSPLFAQAAGVAAGKWLKLDLNELTKANGFQVSQFGQAGNNDPRQGLAFLEGVTKDGIDDLGHEDVRGVDTKHYRATVDLEKAIARSGGVTDRDAFRRFVDSLGSKTVEVDVWIDGDNRVRRIHVPLSVSYESTAIHMTMTMEYFDFGAPVDVAPPPDSDVVDFSGVLPGG